MTGGEVPFVDPGLCSPYGDPLDPTIPTIAGAGARKLVSLTDEVHTL